MNVTHLDKSGTGFAFKTACGRSLLRTPFSAKWSEYKTLAPQYRCLRCDASKQFELNTRVDAKKEVV